jgi:hypothetical protein
MAMSDYLPPIVTELKADISDLAAGFAKAKALGEAYAREMPEMMREAFRSAGRDSAAGFVAEFDKGTKQFRDRVDVSMRDTARKSSETFWSETERSWLGPGAAKVVKTAADVGTSAGTSLAASMTTTMSPLMLAGIGAALAASVFIVPAIGAAIGAALTLGIGAGFIGLAAILLKDQPRILWMSENLGRTVKTVFTKAAMPLTETFVHALVLFENMILRLAPKIEEAFSMVQPAITPLVEGVIGMIENMGPGIKAVLAVAMPLFTQTGNSLPALGTALSEFLSGIAAGGPGMSRFISDMFMLASTYLPMLGTALGWLSMRYLDVTNALRAFQRWLVDAKTTVVEWASAVTDWFSRAHGSVSSFATGALSAVAEWARGVASWLASVLAWFDALPGRVASALSGLKARILNWVVETGGMLYDAGRNLVQGLVNGIQDKLSDAIGAVRRAVSNFAQGARDALGIRSPSTVFAKMGEQSADGYGQGWVARMKGVTGMIGRSIAPAGTTQGGVGGFATGMGASGGDNSANGGSDATPVILQLDGKTIATALIPHAQRTKRRNLTTGLS